VSPSAGNTGPLNSGVSVRARAEVDPCPISEALSGEEATSLDSLLAYVKILPERKVLGSEIVSADFRCFRLGGPTFSTPVLGNSSSSPNSFDVERVRLRGFKLRCCVGEEDGDAPMDTGMEWVLSRFHACGNVGTSTSTLTD